jgi:hypothetical protein
MNPNQTTLLGHLSDAERDAYLALRDRTYELEQARERARKVEAERQAELLAASKAAEAAEREQRARNEADPSFLTNQIRDLRANETRRAGYGRMVQSDIASLRQEVDLLASLIVILADRLDGQR